MTGVDPAAARDAMTASDAAVESWPAAVRAVAAGLWRTQVDLIRDAFSRDTPTTSVDAGRDSDH